MSGNRHAWTIGMGHPTIDKRSERTRNAIETALLRLIERRGYDMVGVNDVCKEAEVSRSTFYHHYANKQDLKRSGLRHLRLALDNHLDAANPQRGDLAFERALFEHAATYRGHYRALVRSEVAAAVLETVRNIVADAIRTKLKAAKTDKESREAAVHFLAGGYVGLLTRWLDSEETMSPPDVGTVLRRWIVQNEH